MTELERILEQLRENKKIMAKMGRQIAELEGKVQQIDGEQWRKLFKRVTEKN